MTNEPNAVETENENDGQSAQSNDTSVSIANTPTEPAVVSQSPSSPDANEPPKPAIAIGSQRDAADKSLKPSQPKAVQAAVANPIDLSGAEKPAEEVLPEIKSLAGFSDDLDAEIEAALGGLSMDEIVSSAETVEEEIEPNTRVKGVVSKIHKDNVFFKLNGQFEGVAALHHFVKEPAEGDLIEVIVRGINKEDGLYELAVPGAAIGVADWEDISEGAVVDARVSGSNTGGLEVMVNSLRGFIPASQIDRFHVDDFSQYVNQKFPCVVIEVNPDKRKLVLSRRAILERENEEKRKELMKELEAGQLREGTVTKLMDFGAFVDLGGVEGLIHVSKLSWNRVKHPSEVVQVGEKVKVKVEKVDPDSKRISLSLRDTLEHPWEKVSDLFTQDDVVKGTVTRVADFGAFVKIAPGVEGLVHVSELAHHRVSRVSTIVSEGQDVEVKILSIDKDKQKISLSIKACLAAPAPKDGAAEKRGRAGPAGARTGDQVAKRTTQGWSRSQIGRREYRPELVSGTLFGKLMLWQTGLRKLLFSLPAERAHDLSMGSFNALVSGPGKRLLRGRLFVADPKLEVDLFGLQFQNPVGLAAGFDKDARWFHKLSSLGFGHIEVGTITGKAQPGNPKPRLFRLPADQAIINRMGFNNAGADAVAKRLASTPKSRPTDILGINIGKTKIVPLETATEDYLFSFERLFVYADYFTINVSSPNTPGLRELQNRGQLIELLIAILKKNNELASDHEVRRKPVLLKIAPDLTDDQLEDIISVIQEVNLDGIIATNTTLSRTGLATSDDKVDAIGAGGLSGRPLTVRSRKLVAQLYRRLGDTIPIIGVGGIMTPEDAWQMILAGASLVQVYSGFVYAGPGFIRDINRYLIQKLDEHGLENIRQAVGGVRQIV